MQDIAWDPLYEYRPPLEYKLFVFYLIAIVAISLAKSVSLMRQLWSLKRGSLPKSGDAKERGHLLAASALANRLPKQLSEGASSEEIAPQLIQEAERKFSLLWESCSSKVQSMKRLVVLTFLLSILLAAYRVRTILAVPA